jgi:hypothetical protein
MKTLVALVAILVLAGSVLGQSGALGQTGPADLVAAEVGRVDHARLAAILKGDFDAVEKVLVDDFLVTFDNGAMANKAEYMDRQRSGQFCLTSAVHDDERVRIYGEAAVITGRSTGKLTVDGKEQESQVRYTHVYVKQQGQWRMVAMQVSAISR